MALQVLFLPGSYSTTVLTSPLPSPLPQAFLTGAIRTLIVALSACPVIVKDYQALLLDWDCLVVISGFLIPSPQTCALCQSPGPVSLLCARTSCLGPLGAPQLTGLLSCAPWRIRIQIWIANGGKDATQCPGIPSVAPPGMLLEAEVRLVVHPLGLLSGRPVTLLLRRDLQSWRSKIRVLHFTQLTELR